VIVVGIVGCAQGLPMEPPPDARGDATAMIDARMSIRPDAPAIPDAEPDAAPDAMVDGRIVDAPPPPIDGGIVTAVIFANDQTSLYKIDPATYSATLVGAFGWPAQVGTDAMADIAIDPSGAVIGASTTKLYSCRATDASCTLLGSLAHGVNALTFVPKGVIDPNHETLVGASSDGSLYAIDPSTAAMTSLGHFSNGHASSGDLAYAGGKLVAAVNPGGANDSLAKVDTSNGATTIVGTTGRPWMWGLATAGGTLVGFTLGRDIVTIDPSTGTTTKVGTGSADWYGAAGR